MKKFMSIAVALIAIFVLAACKTTTKGTTALQCKDNEEIVDGRCVVKEVPVEIDYDSEVTVNVAINYTADKKMMSISYQHDTAYVSTIDGETYTKGELLPVWNTIGQKLHIKFVDKATSADENTNAQFTRLQAEGFNGVDIVNGTGQLIGPEGVKGNFVDIGKYLSVMPNLKAFLDANPSVKVSMTSADGGIYFTPYFDGFGELEQMFLARIDWVEDILDVQNPSFDTDAAAKPTNFVERYVQTPINVNITVANEDGTTRVVKKQYQNNILDVLAAIENPTGEKLANAFRTHMQNTYGSQSYEKLSHVFTGTDAAYDTDELIALMYVVKANPKYLTRQHTNGVKDVVEVYFPRDNTGARIRNLIRGMEMFGLRGVFSRNEYLYFDQTGKLQDVRYEDRFIDGINALSHMYNDKLIVQNPEEGGNIRQTLLTNSNGFITYDYNATSTASSLITEGQKIDPDFKFQAILPPVCNWLGDGNYFHFSEAVRSVKNEAWGIPKAVESDQTKLYRVLKLVDELYDYKTTDSIGTIHLYGPQGWTDGTVQYGNETVYKLSAKAISEMNTLAKGNHINYLRQYVGATMPIGHIRSLGLEFQTLTPDGIEGVERINTAVKAGTFKLAGKVDSTNPWYQLSPTFFPLTKEEDSYIKLAATFRTIYVDNSLVTFVKYGFSGLGNSKTEEAYKEMFIYNGIDVYELIYIKAYRDAYQRTQELSNK